jgi:hypothetical protein
MVSSASISHFLWAKPRFTWNPGWRSRSAADFTTVLLRKGRAIVEEALAPFSCSRCAEGFDDAGQFTQHSRGISANGGAQDRRAPVLSGVWGLARMA